MTTKQAILYLTNPSQTYLFVSNPEAQSRIRSSPHNPKKVPMLAVKLSLYMMMDMYVRMPRAYVRRFPLGTSLRGSNNAHPPTVSIAAAPRVKNGTEGES